MNDLLRNLDLEWLKPFLAALVLPPAPFVLLGVAAVMLFRRRTRMGQGLAGLCFALVWLSGCVGMADALASSVLAIPPPLDTARLDALRQESGGPVAIIVLGGGVEEWAPEYQTSSLNFRSLERLRYGLWLSKQIGWPVGFSGGIGWAQPDGFAREASVAQRIATEEFGRPLKWVEDASRDTRQNADLTAALLRNERVRHIIVVTHGIHMPRSERNFKRQMVPGCKSIWPRLALPV